MVESDIDKIGQVVKAKTMSLQRASSALALRGLAEIAKLDTDPLVSRLIGIIRESESWQELSDAWEKIRKLGPQHGGWERSLKNLIYSSDGWGRIFASESLSWHRCAPEDATPVLIATLEAALENNRNDWARVGCGAIGKYPSLSDGLIEEAIPPLVSALKSDDYNVRGYAARTLGNWGSKSTPALTKLAELLEREDDSIKALYLEVLQSIDPSIKSPLDALTIALKCPDSKVRGEAICAIAKYGSQAAKALPRLFKLANDQSSDVRRFLAFCFGKIGIASDEVCSTLRSLGQDEDAAVRVAAAYGRIKLGADVSDSLGAICSALHSTDEFVRFLASWAIGETGVADPQKSVSALERAFQSETSERVKRTIQKSLLEVKQSYQC